MFICNPPSGYIPPPPSQVTAYIHVSPNHIHFLIFILKSKSMFVPNLKKFRPVVPEISCSRNEQRRRPTTLKPSNKTDALCIRQAR